MSDALKVTFGTVSVLKVTFRALTTTPIKIDNSFQGVR
jgi:hypothetical protein